MNCLGRNPITIEIEMAIVALRRVCTTDGNALME